jgi:hypothetical protein
MSRSIRIFIGAFAILVSVLVVFNFSQRSRIPLKVSDFAKAVQPLLNTTIEPALLDSLQIVVRTKQSAEQKGWVFSYSATDLRNSERLVRLLKLLSESKVYESLLATGDVVIITSYKGSSYQTYISSVYLEKTPSLQNFMQLMRVFGRPE